MALPKDETHTTPYGLMVGGTLDEAMAADLLRPLFSDGEANALLEAARQRIALALEAAGLVMAPAVHEPTIIYSLSLMDRQVRFDVVQPGRPDEVIMQGCVRLLGRLAFLRQPHECEVSLQVMLGEPEASTYFAYMSSPYHWLIRETTPAVVLRRGEHADVLPGRWPEALGTATVRLDYLDLAELVKEAVLPDGRTHWGHIIPPALALLDEQVPA